MRRLGIVAVVPILAAGTVIALLVALAISHQPNGGSASAGAQEATDTPTPSAGAAVMAVDCDTSTPGVQSSCVKYGYYGMMPSFDVFVVGDTGGQLVLGSAYDIRLQTTESAIDTDYDNGTAGCQGGEAVDLGHVGTDGTPTTMGPDCSASGGLASIELHFSRVAGTDTAVSGTVARIHLTCGYGWPHRSTIHLASAADGPPGTAPSGFVKDALGGHYDMTLIDAQVECVDWQPTSTPTPTPTATWTPTVTPTPTSNRPAPVPTIDKTVNGQQGPITVTLGDSVTYRWVLSAQGVGGGWSVFDYTYPALDAGDYCGGPCSIRGERTAVVTLLTPGPVTNTVWAVTNGTGTLSWDSKYASDSVTVDVVTPTPTATAIPVPDSDGDGLSDAREQALGTDPNNPDTDGDGLSDGAEVNTYLTDPLKSDTDGDLLPDGLEVRLGLSPLNRDTDGDGIPDSFEDTDADGLTNGEELYIVGTDPGVPDTDGDGCRDGREYLFMPGFSPLNWYDFYDVPVPVNRDPTPNGAKNQAVSLADVLAVLKYVGTYAGDGGVANGNGVAYDTIKGSCDVNGDTVLDKEGLCYDRTAPSPLPNPPWEVGPPSGAVTLSDVLGALKQVGLDCSGVP